ncbi:MAG: glycosyltransferase family 39 protein [Acidobacteriota bacterium]|nr:glycosyltransferase family 39 protein [Acidobacteriota bacterium]
MKKKAWIRALWIAVLFAGAGLRALDLGRPADGRIREGWREADYAALARNFDREGMDIRAPRIDWRGDGPGLAEMEFPLVPWLTACLYRVFGPSEFLGRVVSYIFALLTLLVFSALARSLLPESGALFAAAFFALAPLSVRVSNSLQPESAMLFFYVAAALAFRRWLASGSAPWYLAALAATAGAVLVKVPSAHIGLLFVLLILEVRGWRGLFQPSVVAFGILALLPAAVWSLHAHRYWLLYGNSLGVSNEFHWIGWDLVARPRLLLEALFRLVRIEAVLAAMIPGFLLAPFVLWARRREAAAKFVIFWLGAVAAYYILTIRTTGDYWASYYHVVSIPALALAFGLAFAGAENRLGRRNALRAVACAAFGLGAAFVAARALFGPLPLRPAAATVLIIAAAAVAGGLWAFRPGPGEFHPGGWTRFVAAVSAAALLALFPLEGAQAAKDLHPTRYAALYECAEAFRPLIAEGALILASGGSRFDETGKRVAYNASYFFYWLDRKGFNLPADDQTLEGVAAFARRGARYFILEDEILKSRPGFKDELARVYPLLAERPSASLFRLDSVR